MWTSGGGMVSLGTLGGNNSSARTINASGVISGTAETPASGYNLYTYNGSMTDLGDIGGNFIEARGINSAGDIAAYGFNSGGIYHAAYWDGSTLQDLGTTPGGTQGFGLSINDAGILVGDGADSGGVVRAWTYDTNTAGPITLLQDLGGFTSARHISDSGLIVGQANTASGISNAAYWSNGVLVNLGRLDGVSTYTRSNASNFTGTIVGEATVSGVSEAWVYFGGALINLETMLDSSGTGWQLNSAYSINDSGQIVGWGTFGGQTRAFLLNPVPEPSSLALLAAASTVMGLVAARKIRARK
jgi:probable HAF family extracellular repeat protein